MSDDVLQNWAQGIAEAEMMSDLPGSDPWADPMHCIRDLAAALRAIRIERDEERMAGHIHSKAADELAQTVYTLRSENGALQTRIAEMKTYIPEVTVMHQENERLQNKILMLQREQDAREHTFQVGQLVKRMRPFQALVCMPDEWQFGEVSTTVDAFHPEFWADHHADTPIGALRGHVPD